MAKTFLPLMVIRETKLSELKANIFGLFMVIDDDGCRIKCNERKGNMQLCKESKQWKVKNECVDTCYRSGHLPQTGSLAGLRIVS